LPPLGPAYIAAVLERHGFKADILDMPILRKRIKDIPRFLKNNQYDLYGLSCNIFNISEGIKIAGLIKEANPDSKVILGGHCNVFSPGLIFKYGAGFDIIVRGEGEEAMLSLCSQFNNGSTPDLYKINGISFKDGSRVINTLNAPYLDLNRLPLPARHLLPHRLYKMYPPFDLLSPVTLIETSRGCMYNCSFCSISQSARERSIENVMEEIREVSGKLGIKGVRFVDSNFVYSTERIADLCDRILGENIKLAWTCETRVRKIPGDLLKKMSAAGCYMIAYGVESGSKKILDLLNKRITTEEITDTFMATKKAGIKTIAYLMLGLPEEDDYSFRETLSLIKKIGPDFVLYTELFPIPGSPLTKKIMESGQITEEGLAEYYILHKDIFRKRSFGGHCRNKIRQRQFFATMGFYFNARFLMRRIREIRGPKELFYLIKGAYCFLLELMDFKFKYVFKG